MRFIRSWKQMTTVERALLRLDESNLEDGVSGSPRIIAISSFSRVVRPVPWSKKWCNDSTWFIPSWESGES
jgi:hypothetical protein